MHFTVCIILKYNVPLWSLFVVVDSSSGYESTDMESSDVDSDASNTSSTYGSSSHVRPRKSPQDVEVRARVSCTKSLSESLKLIIDMPEMCDVKFLVGSDATCVYGVRSIMATRSR